MVHTRKVIAHQQDRELFQKRLFTLSCIMLMVVVVLLLRLFQLQVLQAKTFQTLSARNSLTLIPVSPRRGLIFDRLGVLLAENVPVHDLELLPSKIDDLDDTLTLLKSIITISSEDELQFQKLRKQLPKYALIPLKMRLSEEEIAKLAVNLYRFPGVFINAQLIRHYPHGELFAHVLGYVSRIDIQDLTSIDQNQYSATHYIGKIGIEKYYENVLHGQVGYEQAETDASGRKVRVMKQIPAISGSDIYLTIDSELQALAASALEGKKGAVVAIDPNNGDILAMVSTPSFDPNLFVKGITKSDYAKLNQAPEKPLYNRCLRGIYPLASTIKPYLGLQGLDTGTINPATVINDPGYYELPGTNVIYRDWHPHGRVDLERAIVISCDTYFYRLANQMGIQKMADILSQFGFGAPTKIDVGDENSGAVPTPKWKRNRYGQNWYTGDTIVVGIGQGLVSTTPLQLAYAVSTLSMRGQRMQPHLLFKIRTTEGDTISHTAQPAGHVKLNDERHYETIIKAMEGVIETGTGRRFGYGKPYRAAGKTGTAQVYSTRDKSKEYVEGVADHLKDHSLFIVFAPVEKPKIAVAVIAENAHGYAPEVAKRIVDHYLLDRQT